LPQLVEGGKQFSFSIAGELEHPVLRRLVHEYALHLIDTIVAMVIG
jgi:hypothetical protein